MEKKNHLAFQDPKNGKLSVGHGTKPESHVLKHRFSLQQAGLKVRSVNVTGDNRYLIITFEDSARIRVLDLEKLAWLPNEYEGHTQTVRLTSLSKGNKSFFSASWDGTFRRFEIDSGQCTQLLCGIARSPSCFLDPGEKYLFTVSYQSDYKLDARNSGWCWDLSTGKIIHSYEHSEERHSHEAIDIAYDSLGVYTGSDDGRAYRWELPGKHPVMEYFAFRGTVRKVAVSPALFAAACTDGYIRVHKKLSGDKVFHLPHPDKDLREVRISADETKVWSASGNGLVVCYSLENGEILYNKRLHASWVWSICLMRNEQILVSGGGDGTIVFSSTDTGKMITRLYCLESKDDILLTCSPDEAFPSGCFYTTNQDYIHVFREDRENKICEKLERSDPRYGSYLNKHNVKHLILARLKNTKVYNDLKNKYLMEHKMHLQTNPYREIKSLRA